METIKYGFAVFVGGGLGSLARWGITLWLLPYSQQFPAGTLAANLLSCVVVGMAMGLADHPFWGSEGVRILVIMGFCGGFSTFSTLIREVYELTTLNKSFISVAYALGSFLLGLLTLMLGLWLGKQLMK